MTIQIYHKGWLLYETTNETEAWRKAQQFEKWYSGVTVRGASMFEQITNPTNVISLDTWR
jgi:hypothetical protein